MTTYSNCTTKIFSSNSGIEKFQASVYYLDKEDQSTINIDYSPSRYGLIRKVRDEIRQVNENVYLGKAFYKGPHAKKEQLILYFALDFSNSPRCETYEDRQQKAWELPADYQKLSACEKNDVLWNHIISSRYDRLPSIDEVDAFGLLSQTLTGNLRKKMDSASDITPKDWHKPIHSQGSIAKMKFEVNQKSNYTGLFSESSQCALLRLSLTGNPHQKSMMGLGQKERGVAPGLAMKLFIDGQASQDISLLTSLTGQDNNYNFFAHKFSNQVKAADSLDMKAVHYAFETVSSYPERLSVSGLAEWLPDGTKVSEPKAPSKIVLEPVYNGMSQEEEDIRDKFQRIPKGSTLFKVLCRSGPQLRQRGEWGHH